MKQRQVRRISHYPAKINIRLERHQMDAMNKDANDNDVSVSEAFRQLIEKFIRGDLGYGKT